MLVANLGRYRLGAEELIELGRPRQMGAPPVYAAPTITPSVAPGMMAPAGAAAAPARTVTLSRAEGELLVKILENIVSFKENFLIEYMSYCPEDRWQATMSQAETWVQEVQKQLNAKAQQISIPADAVFKLIDLEKCIAAAKDARLSSAKWAFGISAAATIAGSVMGWKWLSVPAYLAGLALILGRPLAAKFNPDPQDPYQPSLAGARPRFSLGGCAGPKETEEEKKRVKLLERIILSAEEGLKTYYWGEVDCAGRGPESSVCLEKGRFRIRIEGFAGDIVRPVNGWKYSKECDDAINEVGIWEPGHERATQFGPIPERSIHPDTYFVEYVGPNTEGRIRRAGPFGCPMDTRDEGIEDGGITDLGVDGEVAMFDGEGNSVDVPPLEV